MAFSSIKFSGESWVESGDDGKQHETFESYIKKSMLLGKKVMQAVDSGEILRPTRLLTIPRGGLVPADIVSRMLGMTGDQVISMGLSFYEGDQKTDTVKIGQMPSPDLINDQVILVVDEIADTTETLEEVDTILSALHAKAVYYGVVIDKLMPNTRRPDFAAATTDHPDRWVVFPNEQLENLY